MMSLQPSAGTGWKLPFTTDWMWPAGESFRSARVLISDFER
jgi:hypothetical protein